LRYALSIRNQFNPNSKFQNHTTSVLPLCAMLFQSAIGNPSRLALSAGILYKTGRTWQRVRPRISAKDVNV
jgi:hypothetical protein